MKCSKISRKMATLTVDFRKHSGPTPADDMAGEAVLTLRDMTSDAIGTCHYAP